MHSLATCFRIAPAPACGLLAVLFIAIHGRWLAADIPTGEIQVALAVTTAFRPSLPISERFEISPTDLVPLDDGTGRLLLATLGGTIRMLDGSGRLLPEPVLDTAQTGLQLQMEAGMTAVVVHPDFARPTTFGYGKLYTITTENGSANGGLTSERIDFPIGEDSHQDVIREWDLSSLVGDVSVNSLPAMQLSDSRELLRVAQPGPFHNVLDLAFNTSAQPGSTDHGQLYVSAGDGGQDRFESQDLTSIFGNVLRINPDPAAHSLVRTSRNSGLPAYSISPDNPFLGDDPTESTNWPGSSDENDTLAEIYANGLRSPYRLNFDRGTGDLFVGDVGSTKREEVNLVRAGGNYGWPSREGTSGVHPAGGSVDPLFEYSRQEGRTVVGGFVYRGSEIPDLVGKYVFAEFGQFRDSARLFYGIVDPADPDGEVGEFFEFNLDAAGPLFPIDTSGDFFPDTEGPLPDRIFSIGEDEDGELYLVAGQDPRGNKPSVPGAFIIRLVASTLPGDYNGDGKVDAVDYTVWRDNHRTGNTLPNDKSPGVVGLTDYDVWKSNYASLSVGSRRVPEPPSLLVATGLLAGCAPRRRRQRW